MTLNRLMWSAIDWIARHFWQCYLVVVAVLAVLTFGPFTEWWPK